LSNGYPSIDSSVDMAKKYVEAGCDIIEVDFPSSNPYLEGEYIASRMHKALEVCSDYDKYMDGIAEIKQNLPNTKIILLMYEDTVRDIGVDKFISYCKENRFSDLILVGLKDEVVKNRCIEEGIKVSCYVQFNMSDSEIEVAKNSNGFVYMQAKPININVNPQYPTLKDCIAKLRAEGIEREIYCGVGIYTPEDIRMAKEAGADGVFVGSTILKLQHDVVQMQQVIRSLKDACLE
jgi:tryptophan synthase alpha chain